MNEIINFFKNLNKECSYLLKEDIEENMYFFAVNNIDYKYKLISRTLDDVNVLLEYKYGNIMNKRLKKDIVDETTLFIERICRNYDSYPSEQQYKSEFDHFIVPMIK